MQSSVPELTNIASEPQPIKDMYGNGKFANHCIQARRLVEKGVRFVELFNSSWDHHGGIESGIKNKAKEIDQPIAALIKDLKMRGLLDETLIVWGAEFGRTPMFQGSKINNAGRDHHKDAFTMWLAGGGTKPGTIYGATDELGFSITENPVHVHDLNATILQLLGFDHTKLTFRHQGRNYRLTDVHGDVVRDILL